MPVHSPDLQNCAYEQLAPISPDGGSQKHLPDSHFWPLAQALALVHAAPLVNVTMADSVLTPRSSYAIAWTSTMLSGRSGGTWRA